MSPTKTQPDELAAAFHEKVGLAQDLETSAVPGPAVMIEQAAAMAVQDAVAHLRNTQTIANAVLGVAEEMLLRDGDGPQANEAVALAQSAVDSATLNVERISALAAAMIGKNAAG
ncbi:hypothetical protein [Breoghania sp. L-A4]|uniref:hypothetical protein n=1 Tax=Breoghania sp. L-A4 TaxID=2304600 RepID=UPI000E358A9F|nr:hypothetical protein [Breoghania sp. L-A4]AXS41808.1 hypothetical protein D1F64_19620 [Breoghania sp. L-A4]